MTSMRPGTWTYAEEFTVEPEHMERARSRGDELGCVPVGTGTGAALRMLTASCQARSVVEIGTGAGVSGLWLLRGAPQAVLTSIDNEPEHLAAARQAFADAKIPSTRARFITGRAIDVLPRMNENSYDIVLVDADPEHVIEYVEHGLRLARTGGLVLVPRVLAGGRVADPVQRDEITSAYRSLVQETQESSAVLATLSPAGEGLLQLISLAERD